MTVSLDARTPSATVHALSGFTPPGPGASMKPFGVATSAVLKLPDTFALRGAVGSGSVDAAVITLAERVKALSERENHLWDSIARAEDAIDAMMPPRPVCAGLAPPKLNEGWRSDGSGGPMFDPPDFGARALQVEAEHRAALAAHDRGRTAEAARRGLPRLEKIASRMSRRLRRWTISLAPLSPQTQAGLAAKAAAAVAVQADGTPADWTDALMAAVGRDALRLATALADGPATPAPTSHEPDPIIAMHRRARELFAHAELDATPNEEAMAALDKMNALVLAGPAMPPSTPAGALAALEWGREQLLQMMEQRTAFTPWDKAIVSMLDGALDVFRRLPDGVLPAVPAPDADDAPLTVAGIAAMEFQPWPDAEPPADLRASIGSHMTSVELGWGICSKTKAQIATAMGRAIDEGSGDIFGRLKQDLDSTHKLLQALSDVVSTASLRLVVGGSVIACDPRYTAFGDNPCGFTVDEDPDGSAELASEAA